MPPRYKTKLALALEFQREIINIFSMKKSNRTTFSKGRKETPWQTRQLAIHAGEDHFGKAAPVGTPIARTANFTFESTEEMKRWAEGKSSAFIYTRYGNPTLAIAEAKLAALEGAEAAVVAASGSAAISSALLAVLKTGDELIATRQLYGGSYKLLRDFFPEYGHHGPFRGGRSRGNRTAGDAADQGALC